MYAIAFDMDIDSLKANDGDPYNQAYYEVRKILRVQCVLIASELMESQQFCRIHLCHPVDISNGNPLACQILIHGQQPVGMKWIVGLSQIARQNDALGTDRTNSELPAAWPRE